MATRRLNPGEVTRSASPTLSNRTPTASTTFTSSPPVITPSSTTFVFGEQRASSPSFFGVQTVSNRTTPVPSVTTSGTPRFTPSSTPSLAFGDDHDPDRPLPSVERDFSVTSSRQNTPSTTVYTPSTSTHVGSTQQAPDQDTVLQQIGDLRNLRFTSSQTPGASSSQRGTPTPSIHVSPSAPSDGSSQPPAGRADSLSGGIAALHIGSLRADSPGASGMRESRSPSPSRRRRSGSGINRDTHRVENEDPPQALFHMPEVQEAFANARSLTSRVVNVLSSSNLHRESGSSIQSLHQRAIELNGFQLPSSRIVGLVGDSGVGKSSLINSLLDKVDLARASSSGTACTCAVTEYLFHDRDDFIVKVDYFPLDELKKQFEELLTAYRDYQSLPPRNSRGGTENGEDDNDRRTLQRKADLAGQTFRASFRERLEQTPTVLSSMPFGHAVGTMVEWASLLLPQQGRQESFSTIEGCSSRLRELTSESDDSLPSGVSRTCWPFIQKLQVYLKAYILSKGLIITDLPGLRDLNSARKAITERYVRKCHQIFVVARIDRAITDESIREIFELALRANLSKIDVICTRSEEIQVREARHDWPAERAVIEEMQGRIDADTEDIDSLREEIEEFEQDLTHLTHQDGLRFARLQQDCRKAEKSRENHQVELRRHIIMLRNDKVSDRLREQYRNHPIATMLKIFCVSNELYSDNRQKPATIALPYLQLSGIVELRRYCIGIVAESHLRATRRFIKDEIPAFLGSVELWVQAGSGNASAERKQQILDAVSAIQRELAELTSPVSQLNISHTLREEFNSQIHLRMAQSGPQWTADARQASLEWQGWHQTTYKAFCSNYGDHSTKEKGYRCWNEEAMGGMKGDMSIVWDSFAVDLDAHLDRINGAVIQAFHNVLEFALSAGAAEPRAALNARSAMHTLADTLRHRQYLTVYGIEKASESFHSELSCLHTNAFSSIRTAFTGRLMHNTYHAANMDYGNGSDRRRKDLITGKFGSPSLFNDHRRKCKESFRAIARALQEQVDEIVNQQVELVEADLRMLRDENVVLESERDPEFRRRVGAEVERVMGEVERIGHVVEEVS
ncbi:hypothetical protein K458DRAFT_414140 [Lentithecium fluviatile CBS 122367]|uniref:P-loop containing nucleoside triphosphate hydrolase protein n=1 Tax=Lentithecium fluviatile CBS 122367 TaxID=1168545 RepID=A0A6G1JDR7_9PLEO|nr:hypothetical protein K458DRAFT_414140 [Lentithecium fluviatile CBS 122367]